jgi:hypothetical protein
MSVLGILNPTLMDLTKMLAPDGTIMEPTEILNETNDIFDEMTWQEGNLTTGHRHSVRTGIPAPTWGQLYKGVLPSKGTLVQVTDNTGFLEDLSEVDTRLVDLAPNPMQFRAVMDRPHVEGMTQEFVRTLFKGTAADPEKFVGLEARFNSLTAESGDNVLNVGSVGEDSDITSVWLIGWSPRTVFGIVPRGSVSGLTQKDYGDDWVTDANGGRYRVYRTYWNWACGLAVPDWRYVVRAQVDVSELTDSGTTGVNLPFMLSDMIERLPTDAFTGTRLAFYMNRSVLGKLRKQMVSAVTASTLALDEVGVAGRVSHKKKYHFDGIPINRVDQLSVDETVVA